MKILPTAKIKSLGLSTRAGNCLLADNICTVEDLISRTKSDLLKLPNCGLRTLEEIISTLNNHGMTLKHSDEDEEPSMADLAQIRAAIALLRRWGYSVKRRSTELPK